MADRRLLVYGAGGHAKVVADAAMSSGWSVVGFLDADPAKVGLRLLGIPVFVADERRAIGICDGHAAHAVVAVGSNTARKRIYEGLRKGGVPIATVVHARAIVAASASIGEGSVVFAGVVVNPDTRVGCNAIVNTSASLDHDNILGDHTHVSPGAHLGGTVEVGEGTHVGIGATVRNNIRLGAWSVVGAGSVVVKDVPDHVVAFGVPARVVRDNRG